MRFDHVRRIKELEAEREQMLAELERQAKMRAQLAHIVAALVMRSGRERITLDELKAAEGRLVDVRPVEGGAGGIFVESRAPDATPAIVPARAVPPTNGKHGGDLITRG